MRVSGEHYIHIILSSLFSYSNDWNQYAAEHLVCIRDTRRQTQHHWRRREKNSERKLLDCEWLPWKFVFKSYKCESPSSLAVEYLIVAQMTLDRLQARAILFVFSFSFWRKESLFFPQSFFGFLEVNLMTVPWTSSPKRWGGGNCVLTSVQRMIHEGWKRDEKRVHVAYWMMQKWVQ